MTLLAYILGVFIGGCFGFFITLHLKNADLLKAMKIIAEQQQILDQIYKEREANQ